MLEENESETNDKKLTTKEIPEALRGLLVNAVYDDYQELIDAMMDLAKGVQVLEIQIDDNGVEIPGRVYKQKPDKEVGKYLMDQVVGKAKESMNIEGKINLTIDDQITHKSNV